jgi:hypothetical protein
MSANVVATCQWFVAEHILSGKTVAFAPGNKGGNAIPEGRFAAIGRAGHPCRQNWSRERDRRSRNAALLQASPSPG